MTEVFDEDDDVPFSGYDPDAKAWFASLLFWRPSRLSDEEMQLHFSHWDGDGASRPRVQHNTLKRRGLI